MSEYLAFQAPELPGTLPEHTPDIFNILILSLSSRRRTSNTSQHIQPSPSGPYTSFFYMSGNVAFRPQSHQILRCFHTRIRLLHQISLPSSVDEKSRPLRTIHPITHTHRPRFLSRVTTFDPLDWLPTARASTTTPQRGFVTSSSGLIPRFLCPIQKHDHLMRHAPSKPPRFSFSITDITSWTGRLASAAFKRSLCPESFPVSSQGHWLWHSSAIDESSSLPAMSSACPHPSQISAARSQGISREPAQNAGNRDRIPSAIQR